MKKRKGLSSASNHRRSFRFGIDPTDTILADVHKSLCGSGKRSSLEKIAAREERAAAKNKAQAIRLHNKKHYDDYLRKTSICSECGGKVLYFMLRKMYCKQHIHLGQAAYKKKWTPQA